MANIQMQGLAELNKTLQQLPAKIEGNVLRGGLRAAGLVIRDEAKRLAPVGPPRALNSTAPHVGGELRDSIRVSARFNKKKGSVVTTVKAGNSKAWYAHMVEFGTAAHLIIPNKRKALVIKGQEVSAVKHPGAKRQPFMRYAFDTKAVAAIAAMADYIRTRLPKEFKKL